MIETESIIKIAEIMEKWNDIGTIIIIVIIVTIFLRALGELM